MDFAGAVDQGVCGQRRKMFCARGGGMHMSANNHPGNTAPTPRGGTSGTPSTRNPNILSRSSSVMLFMFTLRLPPQPRSLCSCPSVTLTLLDLACLPTPGTATTPSPSSTSTARRRPHGAPKRRTSSVARPSSSASRSSPSSSPSLCPSGSSLIAVRKTWQTCRTGLLHRLPPSMPSGRRPRIIIRSCQSPRRAAIRILQTAV